MVQDPNASRILFPAVNMNPASYHVVGTGPNGASFTQDTSQGTLQVDGLAFGAWTINVEAYSSDPILIGSGSAPATLTSNESTTVPVTVTPIVGFGSLDLTVNWTAAKVEIASVSAELLTSTNVSFPLTAFTLGNGTATSLTTSVPTGYYTLRVRLLDNGANVMGAVDVVRIVNGQTTDGTYNFSAIISPGSGAQVTLTPAMNNPLTVVLTGQGAENEVLIQPKLVTASVPGYTSDVVYVWYLNGVAAGTGPTYTVTGLADGVYRLDVAVFASDGSRAGDASHAFSISHIVLSGNNVPGIIPTLSGGGFIYIVNNGGDVTATQSGTGTIDIVNTCTAAVTVTNTGAGIITVTASGSAPITLTYSDGANHQYP